MYYDKNRLPDYSYFIIQERGTGQLASRRIVNGRCCHEFGGRCCLPIFYGRICPRCFGRDCWGGVF